MAYVRRQLLMEMKGVRLAKEDYVILDHVDWSVKRGECWALKGLNGAGKSTLIKLIQVSRLPHLYSSLMRVT